MRKSLAIIFAAVILALATASAAMAQYPPKVKGNQIQGNRNPSRGPLVLPQQIEPESLPFTGADLTLFMVVGLSAVGIGTLVVKRTRARADS